MRWKSESGQTATENMLVVSVVVIAVVAASYVFVPVFKSGVASLASDVSTILGSHTIGSDTGFTEARAPGPDPNGVRPNSIGPNSIPTNVSSNSDPTIVPASQAAHQLNTR